MTGTALSEKERVYARLDNLTRELKQTRRRNASLKRELIALHAAFDKADVTALRAERDGYWKALSNLLHRFERDGNVTQDAMQKILRGALEHRNMKPGRRRLIEEFLER